MTKLQQLKLIRQLDYRLNRENILTLSRLSEDHLQAAICQFLQFKKLLHWATPNGGTRSATGAKTLQLTGTLAGVPDLFIPHKANYYGLFIELKHGKNKPSPHQLKLMEELKIRGYQCSVIYTLEECEKVIEDYFTMNIL